VDGSSIPALAWHQIAIALSRHTKGAQIPTALMFQFPNQFSIPGLVTSQPAEIVLEFPGDPMQGGK
jgi:hypothetical protein